MLGDISNKFMCSTGSQDLIKEIAFHLGTQFKKASSFIACWLSVYDTSIEVQHMLDVCKPYFLAMRKLILKKKLKEYE